jgi:hypothetical protein
MADTYALATLAAMAERVLQDHVGHQVYLRDPVLIDERARSVLVRCGVQGWDGTASVVVKRNTGDDERGFTEWASLMFLTGLPQAAGIAPRFIAGAPPERLLVMEDLGGSRSLADVLEGGDETMVLHVLRALAIPMARLVMATTGREHDFARVRAALPGAADLGRWREMERWLEGRTKLERWADALGVRLPGGFDQATRHVADVYGNPGPYLAFSHGDPAPSNNHISDDRVRLVDFEYGAYRHALYDMSAWFVLCPLPTAWVSEMERVLQTLLAASAVRHLVADQVRYREQWATMCAFRALAMLTWFPHELLVREHAWMPGWSMRQAMISTTLRLQQATTGITRLDPLAAFGAALASALQARWPELGNGGLVWPGEQP